MELFVWALCVRSLALTSGVLQLVVCLQTFLDLSFPRSTRFVGRDGAGEEVTYDYKFAPEPEDKKIECLCGSPVCRKTLN